MRETVKRKLAKYLDPLLKATPADKYHYWFDLMLNPRYANYLTGVGKLYEIDTFDTRTIINKIMPNFYDYIVAE